MKLKLLMITTFEEDVFLGFAWYGSEKDFEYILYKLIAEDPDKYKDVFFQELKHAMIASNTLTITQFIEAVIEYGDY